jgi:hypothetical protein
MQRIAYFGLSLSFATACTGTAIRIKERPKQVIFLFLGENMGATCKYCNDDMHAVDTCSANTVIHFPNGENFPAVKYEDENGYMCHDCAIEPGGYHHPGCDMERCPRCEGQLISCGCLEE